MPERWERELEKLRDLRAPAATGARFEGGPQGQGMPPSPRRGQRFLAGAVALTVFAVALAFTVRAFGAHPNGATDVSGPDPVVFSFTVTGTGSGTPTATMTVAGRTVEGNGSTYSWSFDGGGMVADTFGSELQFDHWTDVPAGAPIRVDGSASSVSASVDTPSDNPNGFAPPHKLYELALGRASIPSEAGRFVLEFHAGWDQGSRTFYFPISVVSVDESPSTPPQADDFTLTATMAAPADGSAPGLGLEYDGSEKSYPGAGHWAGEPVYVVGMLFSFDRALPTGVSLRIAGDVERYQVSIARARADGRWEEPVALDTTTSPTLPTQPGYYQLEIEGWWPQGHMGYSVAITIGHPSTPSESPLPSVQEGIVPDVVGIGAGDAEKLISQAGYEASVKYAPIPGVAAGIVDAVEPAVGMPARPGTVVLLRVSGTDVPLDGYLTALACSESDMMPFAVSANWGPSAPLDDWVRASVQGVQPHDTIGAIALDPASGDVRGLAVFRGSDELAVIAGSPDSGVEGIACRGSGIGGV